jgi:hypothetical protein
MGSGLSKMHRDPRAPVGEDGTPASFSPPAEEDRRRQVARINVENGWCPCGEELDSECECGISRLGYVQGKAEPLKRSALHPRLSPPDETVQRDEGPGA